MCVRVILGLFAILLGLPAWAANCVTVCYYDAGAVDDSVCEQAPWSNVAGFRDFLPVISIVVLADNPLGNPGVNTFTGHFEYSLASVATTGARAKQGVQVSWNTLAGDCAGCSTVTRRSTFFESLAANDPLTGNFGEPPPARRARFFLEGAEVVLQGISFALDETFYTDLQAEASGDALAQAGSCR